MSSAKKNKTPPAVPGSRYSNWHILLLCAVVVPVYPLLLQTGMLLQHDIFASDLLHSQFPYRVFLGRCLSHGVYPLWMPDLFSGLPYLSQIEAGPLFIPNWFFFGLFDPYVALNLSIIFAFLLGAVGTFFLARSYGADTISASLAGTIFALSGFNVSHVKHMNMHEAAAFLPWMMVCLEQYIREGAQRWLVALSLCIVLQITAGHPQIAYYSLLFLAARFAVFLFQTIFDKRHEPVRDFAGVLAGKSLGLAVSGALGIGVCALQLMTTLKFNLNSIRGSGPSWEFASDHPYYLRDLATFVYPAASGMMERMDYRGTIAWENYGYLGIIPLVLVVFSFLLIRRRAVSFYLAAVVLSLLLVTGPATPLFRLAWDHVPGMKLFRFPTRFLLIAALSAAMLSSMASAYLGKRLLRRWRPVFVKSLLILLFLGTFFDLWYWQRMRLPMDDMNAWKGGNPIASTLRDSGAKGRIYCLFGSETWMRAFIRSKGFLNGYEHYRVAGLLPFGNLSLVHGFQNVEGYTNMVPLRTASFWLWYNLELLPHSFMPNPYDFDSGRLTDEFSSLLNIAHARYIVSPVPVRNGNLALLADGEIKLYENRTALPRAYLAYHWYGARNMEEAATWMFDSRHNRIPAVEDDGSAGSDSAGAILEAACSMPTPNRIEIELQPQAECYLVLTDSFDPGWKAEIDGVPARIHHVNGYQQGVKLNAGAKKAVFVYRPEGFYAGGVISAVSLLALVLWAANCLRSRRLRARRGSNRKTFEARPAGSPQ